MPEPTQFMLPHKELVALIIKSANIHEGRWILGVAFGFSPGNFGPDQDHMSPGVVVAAQQIGIQREPPDATFPPALVVDAAEVNPRPEQPGRAEQKPRRGSRK